MLKSCLYHNLVEAGCDEAGRGCLAGPVFAAAVILPKNFKHPVLNDSKMLTKKEIDEMNILRASIKAMHLAINELDTKPQFLLIDGNRFYPYKEVPHQTIIKGDGLYFSIAAASVLAKTFRDEYMEKIHEEYPLYGWNRNMGYGTKEHREAIGRFGITPYHRRSFNLLNSQMKINF